LIWVVNSINRGKGIVEKKQLMGLDFVKNTKIKNVWFAKNKQLGGVMILVDRWFVGLLYAILKNVTRNIFIYMVVLIGGITNEMVLRIFTRL
jgi:hypothetical protein